MKTLATIFKALSDETRLTMLALLLQHGELCVCDFVEVLAITQSKASRHLRYLLNAGLVVDRRDAAWVHYRLREQPEHAAREVLQAIRPLLEAAPDQQHAERLRQWLSDKQRPGARCAPSETTGRPPAKAAPPARKTPRGKRGQQETSV